MIDKSPLAVGCLAVTAILPSVALTVFAVWVIVKVLQHFHII
jgi:hypothetical protein